MLLYIIYLLVHIVDDKLNLRLKNLLFESLKITMFFLKKKMYEKQFMMSLQSRSFKGNNKTILDIKGMVNVVS